MKYKLSCFLLAAIIMIMAKSNTIAQTLEGINLTDSMETCIKYYYRIEWKVDDQPEFYFTIFNYDGKSFTGIAWSVSSKAGFINLHVSGGGATFDELIFFNLKSGDEFLNIKSVKFDNPPVINSQLGGGTFYRGYPFKMFVNASGAISKYIWYHNGIPIPNSDDDTLYIKYPDYDTTGTYYCEAEGCGLTARSKDFHVNILKGPDIVVQPQIIPFVKGTTAGFKVVPHLTPEDDETVKFRWYKDSVFSQWKIIDGKEILISDTTLVKIFDDKKYAGTISDYLSVNITGFGDRINYYCEVIADWGITFSAAARIIDWFDVKMLTDTYRGCVDADAVLEVEEIGYNYDDVTFQWFKTGGIMLTDTNKFHGFNTPKLTIKNVQKTNMGSYYCLVKHKKTGYWKISPVCAVVPEVPPHILWQNRKWVVKDPTDPALTDVVYIVMYLDNLTKSHYQIFKDGVIIRDSIDYNVRYNPFNKHGDKIFATPADTGSYVIKFWNDCGVTWSDTCHVYWADEDTVRGVIFPGGGDITSHLNNDNNIINSNLEGDLSGNIQDEKIMDSHLETYPNPAESGCGIFWHGISDLDDPHLEIFNSLGKLVRIIKAKTVHGDNTAEFYWDGRDFDEIRQPDGIYYARVNHCGSLMAAKIMLLK